MNKERLMQILLDAKMTEKAARIGDRYNQYMFRVLSDATKPEIKAAVEELFNVKVESVSTMRVPPRTRRFRGRMGVRNGWKKAYVRLSEGHEIDFMVAG
ncbi:MAG: 50S ribosomal protein L23 [Pseudomonadota bacterium]